MKDRFSNSPTLDMSDELLSFFSDLLRVRVWGVARGDCCVLVQAQAQEVKWEIDQLQGPRKELSSIIDAAHKTKSVSGPEWRACHSMGNIHGMCS